MKICHTPVATSATFEDPNLVSASGLVPILTLADTVGLHALVELHLTVPTDKGANSGAKVSSLVAGMIVGADSIDDVALLRHCGMNTLFTGRYAPSTLGSFLRTLAFGHMVGVGGNRVQSHPGRGHDCRRKAGQGDDGNGPGEVDQCSGPGCDFGPLSAGASTCREAAFGSTCVTKCV